MDNDNASGSAMAQTVIPTPPTMEQQVNSYYGGGETVSHYGDMYRARDAMSADEYNALAGRKGNKFDSEPVPVFERLNSLYQANNHLQEQLHQQRDFMEALLNRVVTLERALGL